MTPQSATTSVAPAHENSPGSEWWRSAVIYQIYPRSFADSTGNGIGDLVGITHRLPSLVELGVDAVWLSPFFRSPQKDAGYDVSDYCDVDPIFGSLDDFDELLATAHDLDIRVIADMVPNHTSDQHAWFQAALSAEEGSVERERYMFSTARAPTATCRPTTGSQYSAARCGRASLVPMERPASGTCTSSTALSPTSIGRTRGCVTNFTTSCDSGSIAALMDSEWMSRTE